MRKIPTPFNYPLAPLVLPAVYDDVLSYEEWLSKVMAKLNELIDYINHILEEIDERIDAKIAESLKPILKRLTDLELAVENNAKEIKRIDNKIDEEIESLRADLLLEIVKYYELSKKYTDNQIRLTNFDFKVQLKQINNRITNLAKEFPLVYSPSKGWYTNVEKSIVETWDSLRYFGMTAYEYDGFEFTAKEYDDRLIKAIVYDLDARRFFNDEWREMFNPFTGKHESIKNVVAHICDLLKWNGKKANQYDGYQFTAAEFDNSTFTAYPQDSNQYYTAPDVDLKNKSYENYLFRGTITENDPSLTTQLGSAKYLVLSQAGSPDVLTVKAETTNVVLPSGTTLTITVANNEATIAMGTGADVSIYTATQVYDVTELDA